MLSELGGVEDADGVYGEGRGGRLGGVGGEGGRGVTGEEERGAVDAGDCDNDVEGRLVGVRYVFGKGGLEGVEL